MIITEISKDYNREDFDCGIAELNNFLTQYARQSNNKNIAKTYILVEPNSKQIKGFYTLTSYFVYMNTSHKAYKNYQHPLPAIKLAKLAVDNKFKQQKLGQLLLIDAIKKTVAVEKYLAIIGLFVNPTNTEVINFYTQYGFLPLASETVDIFEYWMPINLCKKVVAQL